MSVYDRVKKELKDNRLVVDSGGYNCIPWSGLGRLSQVVPGIEKKKYYLVTANSKIGKTQLAEFMFVHQPIRFVETIKPKNIKLKIFYFSLEQSKEEKILAALSNKVFEDTNKIVSPSKMLSVFNNYKLEDGIINMLDNYDSFFQMYEQYVEYIDNIRNPFGIYQYCREFYKNNGTILTKNITIDGKTENVFDRYIPNDPDLYVIIITDHLSLLSPENGKTQHESITNFSSNYCIKLRNLYGATVVNIQQQAAAQEMQQFNQITGKTIVEKLKPSADGLGDNKLTARDCNVLLGLFAPYRYGISTYNEYDIERLQDNYRELSVLFNRGGESSITTDLYFNGAVNHFNELPVTMTEANYKSVESIRSSQV